MVLNIVLWTIIIASFIISFVGLVYPIIPSVLVIWLGIFLYHFGINPDQLSWLSWVLFVCFTLLLFLADYLANLHFVDKAGGSKWGMRAATIGLIVGSFIVPPLGIIIIPFLFVLIAELAQKKLFRASIKVAFATLIAFLSSTLAKAVVQVIMIVVFLVDIFLNI